MLKALAVGLGVGAAVQAFRKWPPDGPVSADSVAFVFVLGLVCAYLGGRWSSRGSTATATATAIAAADASATAQNHVQVAFIVGEKDRAGADSLVRVPDESAVWFGQRRQELTADDLEGMDVEDLQQLREAEGVEG